MALIEKRYRTVLPLAPDRLWRRVISADGLKFEMAPLLRMSLPPAFDRLETSSITLGEPLFTSTLYLFGIVPIGRFALTFVEFSSAHFVEQSRMTGMRSWRHGRRVEPDKNGGAILSDHLSFEPVASRAAASVLVDQFFEHRHRRLKRWAEDRGGSG